MVSEQFLFWDRYYNCKGLDSSPAFRKGYSQPFEPTKINEFRSRCKRHGFDILPGIADAMVVWIRNYAYTDPYPSEDKGKVGKKKRKM